MRSLEYRRCSLILQQMTILWPHSLDFQAQDAKPYPFLGGKTSQSYLFHPVIYILEAFWKWIRSVCDCLKNSDRKNQLV